VVTVVCLIQVDVPRVVERETAEDWANSHGMLFLEASAKTKEGISQVFHEVVQKILENPKLLAINSTQPNQKLTNGAAKRSGGCC
jgi:Ras-related protein Rab-18